MAKFIVEIFMQDNEFDDNDMASIIKETLQNDDIAVIKVTSHKESKDNAMPNNATE